MGIESLLSLENPVFSNYAFYATLVVLKMYAMGPLTSIQRTTKNVSQKSLFCSVICLDRVSDVTSMSAQQLILIKYLSSDKRIAVSSEFSSI